MEPGHVRVRRDPLGVTLIIGAWNEPYMLTLAPLVAAIAAGNTAVLKPSEIAEATAAQTAEMVPKYLDPEAVAVVVGGIPETTALLAQKWDLIFFTGSPPVGKIVHQAAAKNLTPAVLELGGKNPDHRPLLGEHAGPRRAASPTAASELRAHLHRARPRAGVAGGQGRVRGRAEAGDPRLLRRRSPAEPGLRAGHQPQELRPARLLPRQGQRDVAAGGQTDPDELYIAPTVLVDVPVDSPIMQEEVFGPILPVLEIDSVEAVIDWVNERPRPLGLYVFAEDDDVVERILEATNSGDACVNDCAIHPLVPELPFGGVGNSGMGKYHGRWGFEAFTNARGVLYHSARIDPGVKYPPYAEHTREREVMDKLL